MALRIEIATGSSTPIYRQIVDQIRLATATQVVAPGDKLPSVRALAEQLVVNPNTVARAYGDLVREGMLVSQQGRGVFVAEKRTLYSPEERERRLRSALDAFVNEVLALDYTPEELLQALATRLADLSKPVSGGSS